MSTPVESFVSACASPPSIESKYTCDSPPREERNASVFPSGGHTGDESCPLCVNCVAEPPVVGTIQMLLALRLASMSGVATVYTTHFPSGETCGSETRCKLIMSSNVIACLSWAHTPPMPLRTSAHATATCITMRFIHFSPCTSRPTHPARGIPHHVTIRFRFQYAIVSGCKPPLWCLTKCGDWRNSSYVSCSVNTTRRRLLHVTNFTRTARSK